MASADWDCWMAGPDRRVWLREISQETFDEQKLQHLGGDGDLFVVVENTATDGFTVVAKAASGELGVWLAETLARGMRTVERADG